jgi:hypothetical protein
MEYLLSLVTTLLGNGIFVIAILLFFYLRQRKAQENDIPPLDVVDAKKLNAMVGKQTKIVLKPLLEAKGYSPQEIELLLTRTSIEEKTFRP